MTVDMNLSLMNAANTLWGATCVSDAVSEAPGPDDALEALQDAWTHQALQEGMRNRASASARRARANVKPWQQGLRR